MSGIREQVFSSNAHAHARTHSRTATCSTEQLGLGASREYVWAPHIGVLTNQPAGRGAEPIQMTPPPPRGWQAYGTKELRNRCLGQ